MPRELTQRQKIIEAQRHIKHFIKYDLEPMMLDEVEEKINYEQMPDSWYMERDLSFFHFVKSKYIKGIL